MKKLLLLILIVFVIGIVWWAVGDFMDKTTNLRERSAENANTENAQGNQGEKFTSKMLGWLGIAHGGDPNKPETWDVINGIKVPPMPDTAENNKTIGGIDINNNGVRDDVERLAAEKFGADKELFPKLMEHSKTERSAMMTLNADDVVAHKNFSKCLRVVDYAKPFDEQEKQWQRNVDLTKKLNILTYAQANTNERGKAYAKAILIRDSRVKDCHIRR